MCLLQGLRFYYGQSYIKICALLMPICTENGRILKQNPVSEWILMMRSLNWISAKFLMSVQHEWEIWLRSNEEISLIKIHSLTGFCFVFILLCFFQYISSRIVYFLSKYYELLFIVKVEGVPSQQLKCSISLSHDVTVNTHCYKTMGGWCCLGN